MAALATLLDGYLCYSYRFNKQNEYLIDPSAACICVACSRRTQTSTWVNFGLWSSETPNFPQACEDLAFLLGKALDLNAKDCILDVGCGRGDQLVLWKNVFSVSFVHGIDYCQNHVESARQLLQRLNLTTNIELTQASATQPFALDRPITKILSLDAAYHFNTRLQFLKQTVRVLPKDGTIGLVDLILTREFAEKVQSSRLYQFLLHCLGWLTGIPYANFISLENYEKQLKSIGYSDITTQQLDNPILDGFVQFVERQNKFLKRFGSNRTFEKFAGSASLIRFLRKHRVIHMILITARQTRGHGTLSNRSASS